MLHIYNDWAIACAKYVQICEWVWVELSTQSTTHKGTQKSFLWPLPGLAMRSSSKWKVRYTSTIIVQFIGTKYVQICKAFCTESTCSSAIKVFVNTHHVIACFYILRWFFLSHILFFSWTFPGNSLIFSTTFPSLENNFSLTRTFGKPVYILWHTYIPSILYLVRFMAPSLGNFFSWIIGKKNVAAPASINVLVIAESLIAQTTSQPSTSYL